MSQEALSLDISHLVSRVVRGEVVDTAERGAALAAKYPDLKMSGALIGQAIDRAVGMVGEIRNAPAPVKPTRLATPKIDLPDAEDNTGPNGGESDADASIAGISGEPAPSETTNGHAAADIQLMNGHAIEWSQPQEGASRASVEITDAAFSIDDDLAAAIDAEIGGLVSGNSPGPAPLDAAQEAASSATIALWNGEAHDPVAESSETSLSATLPPAAVAVEESPLMERGRGSVLSSLRRALFRT